MNQVPHSDNTGVACFTIDGDKVTVLHESDASHLSEELSTFHGQRWWKKKGGVMEDANLWFQPLDLERESEFYRQCRQEAWMAAHGTMDHFDGDGFLAAARKNQAADRRGVTCAMLNDSVVGLLQMDFERDAAQKAGWIPFYYMTPEGRGRGMGIQLLGEAVSCFRAEGRDRIRLRCAPENAVAQRFYQEHGFGKIGEDPTSPVPLDIMEKYIGYEEQR
jgi:probable phosphoglycerate mutase